MLSFHVFCLHLSIFWSSVADECFWREWSKEGKESSWWWGWWWCVCGWIWKTQSWPAHCGQGKLFTVLSFTVFSGCHIFTVSIFLCLQPNNISNMSICQHSPVILYRVILIELTVIVHCWRLMLYPSSGHYNVDLCALNKHTIQSHQITLILCINWLPICQHVIFQLVIIISSVLFFLPNYQQLLPLNESVEY